MKAPITDYGKLPPRVLKYIKYQEKELAELKEAYARKCKQYDIMVLAGFNL